MRADQNLWQCDMIVERAHFLGSLMRLEAAYRVCEGLAH